MREVIPTRTEIAPKIVKISVWPASSDGSMTLSALWGRKEEKDRGIILDVGSIFKFEVWYHLQVNGLGEEKERMSN